MLRVLPERGFLIMTAKDETGNGGGPGAVPARFKVRPEAVILVCIAWMSVPFIAVFIYIAEPWHWLAYVGLPFLLTSPVPLLTVLWTQSPGSVRRFGTWLEQHLDTAPRPKKSISRR
jgi:hypothetical protein